VATIAILRVSSCARSRTKCTSAHRRQRIVVASSLSKHVPALKELGVELIEQPFPADADNVLETLDHPIPVCSDESATQLPIFRVSRTATKQSTLSSINRRLTEALQLYQRARENNFKILIGCMVCTSLSIAPARLLAGNADWVDLDGPLLLAAM